MIKLFALLVAFQAKHFVCDYPLQTSYMLGKGSKEGWIKPLAYHCAVHAFATLIICIGFGVDYSVAVLLSLMDFSIHFVMDRIKASPNLLGKYSFDNPKFWYSLGFDQMIHHLTHYLIIFFMILNLES